MVNRRKILVYLVAAGFLVGAGFMAIPFVFSLAPNAKSSANVPTFSVNDVPVGSIRTFDQSDYALIVGRPTSESFVIFEARKVRSAPDSYYFIWPGFIHCHAFEIEGQSIVCNYLRNRGPAWGFDGKPLRAEEAWVPPLQLLEYRVTNGFVRYGPGA